LKVAAYEGATTPDRRIVMVQKRFTLLARVDSALALKRMVTRSWPTVSSGGGNVQGAQADGGNFDASPTGKVKFCRCRR